jgi:hypothetical protein
MIFGILRKKIVTGHEKTCMLESSWAMNKALEEAGVFGKVYTGTLSPLLG